MEVGIEYGQELTVFVEYFVGLDICVVHGDALVLLEGDAIQAGGQAKYSLDNLAQLKIWAEGLFVEIEFLFLQLFYVIGKVPRLHFKFFAFHFFGYGLNLFQFMKGGGLVSFQQLV